MEIELNNKTKELIKIVQKHLQFTKKDSFTYDVQGSKNVFIRVWINSHHIGISPKIKHIEDSSELNTMLNELLYNFLIRSLADGSLFINYYRSQDKFCGGESEIEKYAFNNTKEPEIVAYFSDGLDAFNCIYHMNEIQEGSYYEYLEDDSEYDEDEDEGRWKLFKDLSPIQQAKVKSNYPFINYYDGRQSNIPSQYLTDIDNIKCYSLKAK